MGEKAIDPARNALSLGRTDRYGGSLMSVPLSPASRASLSIVAFVVVLTLTGCGGPAPDSLADPPPSTRRDDVVEMIHDVEIVDPYRWLEDQESPETREWLDAQNAYTLEHLGDRPERPAIERRLAELLRIDPCRRADRETEPLLPVEEEGRRRPVDSLPSRRARRGGRGPAGPAPLSSDHTTDVDIVDNHPRREADGLLDPPGWRRRDRDSSDERRQPRRPAALPTHRPLSWPGLAAGRGRLLLQLQDRKTGIRVHYHAWNKSGEDPVVFGDGYGPGQWINAVVSDNGRHLLFLVSHGWARTELHYQDLEAGWPDHTVGRRH